MFIIIVYVVLQTPVINLLRIFYILKYKKILLLRCIHHSKSDLINNMDHMRISGTKDLQQSIKNDRKLKAIYNTYDIH